jgi:hypothetical protein
MLIVLARKDMLETVLGRGVGEPIYMDTTHGLQRCVLKVVALHIKDKASQGVLRMLTSRLHYVLLHG